MHIYRIYNSLSLDPHKYSIDMNAFILGEKHADKVVDKVGDLQLYYGEYIDDSDWINPNLIKAVLLKTTSAKDLNSDITNYLLDLIENEKLIPYPEILNGDGYKWYKSNYVKEDIIEIDICSAEEKSVNYYRNNNNHAWFSKVSNDKFENIYSSRSIISILTSLRVETNSSKSPSCRTCNSSLKPKPSVSIPQEE